MPRPVDNNNIRDLEEIDSLYRALQSKDNENARLHENLRKVTNDYAELQKSYLLLQERMRCPPQNHASSRNNEVIAGLQEANQSLVEKIQALNAEKKAYLRENDVFLARIGTLTEENLDLKGKLSSSHQAEDQRLQEVVKEMVIKVQKAEGEKGQAWMLVDLKERDLKKLESEIRRLTRENQFLKTSQDDSSGAASPDVLPAAEYESSGFSFDAGDCTLRRSNRRFSSTRLPHCQLCKKPINPRDQVEECHYHEGEPVGIQGWKNIDKFAEYASDPSYKDFKYWPCCGVFRRTAVRGCMTGVKHVVNAVK